MEKEVLIWWVSLSVITLLNILVWLYSVVLVRRQKNCLSIENYILTRQMLILSGVYVFGCAIRAVLPRVDAHRIVLIDHWLSSILVGRTSATLAELCFIAQWALLLYAIGKYRNNYSVTQLSYWIFPIIFMAELFSWASVISTGNFGHVIEESLWVVAAILVLICLVKLYALTTGIEKKLFVFLMFGTIFYILFMITVDIPMYYERWQTDIALNRKIFSLVDGVRDLTYRWIVMVDWKTWKPEVPWMSLYYSVAVWMSIAMIYVPVIEDFRRDNKK